MEHFAEQEHGRDSSIYALAEIIFPLDVEIEGLYLRRSGTGGIRAEEFVGLSLGKPGDQVCFDSYINSFYENYWEEYTAIDNLILELECDGTLVVEVERVSYLYGQSKVVSTTIGSTGQRTLHQIQVPRPNPDFDNSRGRLFFTISYASEPASLNSARWATRTLPRAEPKVGLAICTFNKPDDVVRNLHLLAEVLAREPAFAAIFVVDQGAKKVKDARGLDQLLQTSAPLRERLKLIEQDNLGGAGGFTRGMMETFADPSLTHVLVMDDDVVVEPSALGKLANLLRYETRGAIVGGCMLDLYHRTRLYAHAERMDFTDLMYKPVTEMNLDMSKEGAADAFLNVVAGNYNGWWLCCIPRHAVERCGLPLPVFVRCDDSEFGTRATSRGIDLVTFPAISIWHEPFYAKITAWMIYYEFRNFIIAANLREKQCPITRQLSHLRRFWEYLETGLFDHSYAIVRAIEDYCKGPAFVFCNTIERHKALLPEIAHYKPTVTKVKSNRLYHLSTWGVTLPIVRKLSNAIWILFQAPAAPALNAKAPIGELYCFTSDHTYRRPELVIHNHFSSERVHLRTNPPLARKLLGRMLKALFIWWWRRDMLQQSYEDAFPEVSSQEFWRAYLRTDAPSRDELDNKPNIRTFTGREAATIPTNG